MNVTQITKQSVSLDAAVLPGIEAVAEEISQGNQPTVLQTATSTFQFGSATYSFVGVFTKIS